MKLHSTLLGLILLLNACTTISYPVSDHFDGKRFFNPGASAGKSFADFLKWQFTRETSEWPEWRDAAPLPVLANYNPGEDIAIEFINHATFLLRMGDLNILTDPIYSDRASPVSFAGPKRVTQPGIPFDQLPKIDVVLISHNHYDHMDAGTISRLTNTYNPLFIVPLGNGRLVQDFGAQRVIELDWWQDISPPRSDIRIFMVPSQHWSARGFFDRNVALWSGFVIRKGTQQIYFAGDTGYGQFFKDIRRKLGAMDVSILPIGAYAPRWFMRDSHMNPDDAVLAHMDLESELSLGSHFGTFPMADDGIDDPLNDLKVAIQTRKIPASSFYAPSLGERIALKISRRSKNELSDTSKPTDNHSTDNHSTDNHSTDNQSTLESDVEKSAAPN